MQLLRQLLQILQIMAGYQNTGVLSDANIYLGDLRISVSACICSIQKSHTIYAELTAFKSQSDKIIYSQAVVQCLSQSRLDESINFFIVLKKRICMLRVSSQILARMESSSKFALVMVVKRFIVTRWLTDASMDTPCSRKAVVTADNPLVT